MTEATRKGTYISNKETESPTHFCWVCKKVFIMDDEFGAELDCLHCGPGTKLIAYHDAPPAVDDLLSNIPGLGDVVPLHTP